MPDIKGFLPSSRPSGLVFIALNSLRILSIIVLSLVLSANIVTMAEDIKAIKANNAYNHALASSNSTSFNNTTLDWDCDYVEYSTVPDQTGGAFWSILNRLFIVFECILLTMSEVGVPKVLFEEYLPILGPAHGLGCLGVFQALIGAQVLSHYCDRFPQVSSWMLFIVGCFNTIVGILLRSRAKPKRLIFSWENASTLTPQTRMAATAWDIVSEKRKAGSDRGGADDLSRSSTKHSQHEEPLVPERVKPGAKFGGFGFGRQGEKAAAERGWKISRPVESLPKEYVV